MNFFEAYDWNTILQEYPVQNYDIKAYHKILSPDYPDFINKYTELPLLQRLKGIGLLCGTDWTSLYKNRFYYSRLDHSIGVALIIWHFTKNKAQTIAGLLHDVSTPVFSHVSDFRKGDALTQTVTEEDNEGMIKSDQALNKLLMEDGLSVEDVKDYHKYPVADNEIPQLSADRLEYMFPSGMALHGSWTLEEIERCYNDIKILQNEEGLPELGFCTNEIAELYCQKVCMTGHILQLNENKLCLNLLGEVMNLAVKQKILAETDFMTLSESKIIQKLEEKFSESKSNKNDAVKDEFRDKLNCDSRLFRLYKTFRTMTKIEHTDKPLFADEYYNISLKVKQRYINPLVKINANSKPDCNSEIQSQEKMQASAVRLSQISTKAKKIIDDFIEYKDTEFGCVKLWQA